MDTKDRIVKLKHEYDVYRTEYAVAQSNIQRLTEDMKKLGVTPKNIDASIEKLKSEAQKLDELIAKRLDKIDDELRKNK